jgi:hypothetical protein
MDSEGEIREFKCSLTSVKEITLKWPTNGLISLRSSAHGATQKKPIGYANYQPVASELLPL